MNATQCRMARAGLGWTLDDLASSSGVNRRSIIKFENDVNVSDSTVAKLRLAVERAGIVLIERGVHLGGVVPPMEGR